VQRGWAVYEQNELFSLALQALFSAVLGAIERDSAGRLRSVEAAGDVCVGLLSFSKFGKRRVVDVVSELRSSLPAIGAWQDDAHEIQRGWKIVEAGTKGGALELLVEEGVQVLLSLLVRGLDENPYAEFEFEPDHFDSTEIHLLSFKQAWQSTWADMTIEQWVRGLAIHWGIQRHLSVALRNLRGERRDTFRIRPLEQELRVIEVPPPAATVPRLGKAFQILRDLDLTDVDADSWPILTSSGQRELEACLASCAAFSLLDALSETGFQASVIATYCCYFPFYEEVVFRRLLDRGCTNNILMVDAGLCAQAFASEDTRPRRAGRDYTLIPVHLHGAFHPKLIVAVGKSKGALFVALSATT
jgi:hypothetical protein